MPFDTRTAIPGASFLGSAVTLTRQVCVSLFINFKNRQLWLTLSNAFDKSIEHRFAVYPALMKRSVILLRCGHCYRQSSVVCPSVRRLVCHDREPCKNGWNDRDGVWHVDSGVPKEACVGGGAHWRNLTNTIEPSGAEAIRPHVKLLWPLVQSGDWRNSQWA